MGEDDARRLLDEAMTLRRKKIRKKWTDIADQAGMKYQSLHRLRTNPQVGLTDLAAAGIEDAMNWSRGTIAAVMGLTITPEDAAELPVVEIGLWSTGPPRVTTRRRRTLIDPIASPIEEINAFLMDLREVDGDEVADELEKSIVKARALAERKRNAVTSKEHEEL